LDEGAEGAVVLVGHLDHLTQALTALVRLTEPIVMPKTTDIFLPVKIVFIVFTPSTDLDLDHHEIGRSMATLLSNPVTEMLNVFVLILSSIRTSMVRSVLLNREVT